MDALRRWPLPDLIRRALRERLVDDCRVEEEFVVIVQGSTRFILDHVRAHAFLRGVVGGMSRARRGSTPGAESAPGQDARASIPSAENADGFDAFDVVRRQVIQSWWDRYTAAGSPFGRTVSGLLMWIRYRTRATVN